MRTDEKVLPIGVSWCTNMMTDDNDSSINPASSKRRVFIREHVYKRGSHLEQIQFEFNEDSESSSPVERNYNLWLTRDHYARTMARRYGYGANRMPSFEDYIDTLRPLIAGHCCPERELRRAFSIFDQNRNGIIELREMFRLVSIVGRSTTESKIASYIERVNTSDARTLNYLQFKQFVRLGFGREMLVHVSLEE